MCSTSAPPYSVADCESVSDWLQHHPQLALQVWQRDPGGRAKAEPLQQIGQEEEELHPGQGFAQADARPRPKWQETGRHGALALVVKETLWARNGKRQRQKRRRV